VARRAAPTLKRRLASREPKRQFIIFSEGRNTEPAYFHALAIAYRDTLIHLEIQRGVGVPYTIAERAAERARQVRRSHRNSYEEHDEIWAVFDRDTHPRIDDAVALCVRNRVGVARSNPCFELWLILHEADYDKPDDSRFAQALLCRLRPEYDPSSTKLPNCSELIARIEVAENRAEAQLARREAEGEPYGRPSTTVFCLTRAIRAAAKLKH
jgi:hypothetical protein